MNEIKISEAEDFIGKKINEVFDKQLERLCVTGGRKMTQEEIDEAYYYARQDSYKRSLGRGL